MYTARLLTAQVILSISLSAQAGFHSLRMDFRGVSAGEGASVSAAIPPAVAKPKSFGLVSEKALRDYVQKNVSNIQRVSASPQYSAQQKLEYIKATVEAVAQYRAKNWSKSSYAEHEMDMTIKPFESFPDAKDFKANRCNQYQHHLILEWEPGAQDLRPGHRGVSEALNVLRRICRT